MALFVRASIVLTALFVVAFSQPVHAGQDSLNGLVERLEVWLDDNSPWERRSAPPTVRMLPPSLATGHFGSTGLMSGKLRAFYDDRTMTITLVSPWNIRDPSDQSVLLHELVHHRQAPHHWYCPGAQELPAYKLQAAWADANGAKLSINWIAVVLESGCSRKDFHPD